MTFWLVVPSWVAELPPKERDAEFRHLGIALWSDQDALR